MNYDNEINKFYAPLPPEERKRAKEAVMKMQNLKTDKSFHNQRNGKTDLSLFAGLIWSEVLEQDVRVLFVLKK